MSDLIGPNNLRIDDESTRGDRNSREELAFDFSKKISDTVKLIEQRGGKIPENSRKVVVEKGDCLWTIAEKYGVDPQTLINDNKQFQENPDLIHPGEIVVVRLPDSKTDPEASGKAFGEQITADASTINREPKTDSQADYAMKQWDDIEAKSKAYFAGVPKENRDEVLDGVIATTSGHTRQAALEGYLQSLTEAERPGAVTALKEDHASDASAITDIEAADKNVAG